MEGVLIMKKITIPKNITRLFNKVGLKARKHSPEILVVAGVIGTVASAVMACKATTKVSGIIDEAKDEIEKVHTVMKDESYADKYTESDGKKDLTIIYAQTGLKLVKLYAPSVILGVLSLGSILASNNILRKRNVALAAAYATIDNSFKDYRKRVVERFGAEVDKQLKYNIKAKEIEETVVDENGDEKKIKKCSNVLNPSDISGYARFFEQYTVNDKGESVPNPYWDPCNEYNIMFLKAQERYANDLLRAKGIVFLNEVYEMLGLPKTKAGQVVGWTYDEENPMGDNYIDFGMYADNLSYSDYANGFDPAILLDFNVDGNIWESM